MAEKITGDMIYESTGYILPQEYLSWTPETTVRAMDKLGIEYAILSLTGSPSPNGEGVGEANRAFARRLNLFVAEACAKYPQRLGFFANVPIPSDTKGKYLFRFVQSFFK